MINWIVDMWYAHREKRYKAAVAAWNRQLWASYSPAKRQRLLNQYEREKDARSDIM